MSGNPRYTVERVGKCHQLVVIIDEFHPHPDHLRAMAQRSHFQSLGPYYPGVQAPAGGFARAATFFPPATPILLLLRNAIPPGLPWWELALGVLVCIAFMIFTVWAAAKIFRVGVLMYGQPPTIFGLIKWLRYA